MSETATPVDTASLTGKRVTLTFSLDGETVTKEGRVEMGTHQGLIFKEKGKSSTLLIEAGDVKSVEELASKEPNVAVKKLQPIPLGRVRQHLADRHGYPKDVANALTEQQAFDAHAELDHGPLAHVHVEPDAKTDAEAGDESSSTED